MQLRPHGNDEDSYPSGGNDYGGSTLHWVYNSDTNEGTGLAADADWRVIAAALETELVDLGYGAIAWDFAREPYPHETQAERDADVRSVHGSLDPEAMWVWSGLAEHGSMWVWVTIWDERRPSAPAESMGAGESGVSLFVGGTIIAAGDEQAYVDGVAPFDGLARPEATHSS